MRQIGDLTRVLQNVYTFVALHLGGQNSWRMQI